MTGLFSLEVVACIGACGLAPVICVNGEFHAKVTRESLQGIIDEYRNKENSNERCTISEGISKENAQARFHKQEIMKTNLKNISQSVDFLVSDPSAKLSDDRLKQLKVLRREDVEVPVIFIGTGTCGLGAGAGKTILAAQEYLTRHNIER